MQVTNNFDYLGQEPLPSDDEYKEWLIFWLLFKKENEDEVQKKTSSN